jgi:hypothetical protein
VKPRSAPKPGTAREQRRAAADSQEGHAAALTAAAAEALEKLRLIDAELVKRYESTRSERRKRER